MESELKTEAVLPKKFGGGPHGLGDPNDRSLRKVEIEVLIPKKLRDKTRVEKCIEQVKAFEDCCKNSGIGMVVSCRKENSALWECLTKWYGDEAFKQECKEEYLKERTEYRKTGIGQKQRRTESSM